MIDRINLRDFNQIQKINPIVNNSESKTQQVSFSDTLKQALDQVNQLEKQSSHMGELLAAGKIDNIHDVTIAGQKASVAIELTVQVRNKVVEAYQEVMRMQV
jgi:flagellar hook-basal body complex protein FliE